MNTQNYVCSTYFKINADKQSGTKFSIDDFQYMKEWYESAHKYGLKCVIFYDNLTDDFLEKHKNEITFIKVAQEKLNIIDYRWIIYDEYLKNNKENINLILFTDISDVIFLKNPFDLIATKPEMLFIGDEETTVGDPWIVKRSVFFKDIIPDIMEHQKKNSSKKLLNCGIVGGNVKLVSELVTDMARILSQGNFNLTTFDMSILNYLMYTKYPNRFLSGKPLNTRFKYYEKNNVDCYIKHK